LLIVYFASKKKLFVFYDVKLAYIVLLI